MNNNKELIQTLTLCAAACEFCEEQCLNEENIHMMVKCIRLDRDCSQLCRLTASFLSRNSERAIHLVEECAEICKLCADECEKHEEDHCQQCARACRQCEEACRSYQTITV